jgi:hypothetical protein
MTAFEVHLNGKKQCLAGVAEGTVDTHFFSAGVRTGDDASKGYLAFIVNGLDSRRDEHVEWAEYELAVGDEIRLRVVSTERADSPKKRSPAGGDRPGKEAMARRLAEELGWEIVTK